MVDLSISIVPSQNRLEAECHRLSEFRESLTNFSELPALIEKAKECMGISTTSSAFSNDVLRVEISGPTQQLGCKQGPQWGPVDFKDPFMGAHGPSPGPLLF